MCATEKLTPFKWFHLTYYCIKMTLPSFFAPALEDDVDKCRGRDGAAFAAIRAAIILREY